MKTINLTDKKIERLSKPGLYRADKTLYLRIRPSGCKSWIQRITIGGRRVDRGLGPWPEILMDEAKRQALETRRDNLRGELVKPTFRQAATDWLETNTGRWKNPKTPEYIRNSLEQKAFPYIGSMQVHKIKIPHIEDVLKPLSGKPAARNELRQRLRAIFDTCLAREYIDFNPCDDRLDALLPKSNGHKSHKAMPYQSVPVAVEQIRNANIIPTMALALEFCILTAARSGEVRGAQWAEIDVENRTWVIPAARMKTRTEHRVPLSDAALVVIDKARNISDGSKLLFPSPTTAGMELNGSALVRALKAAGLDGQTTVHGFRSAFRTWAGEQTNADHAVMELSLAHRVGSDVERAYARTDLFAKRCVLMSRWAAYVTGKPGDVISLAAGSS